MRARTDLGLEANLPPRLRLAVMRLSRRLRQEAQGDSVSASQQSALSTLDHHGPMTLGALAAHERVQPPTMTKIAARLEELGLVGRTIDPGDRRIARLELTEAGRRHVAKSRSRTTAFLAQRLRQFTHEELAQLDRCVPLLERLVEEHGAK